MDPLSEYGRLPCVLIFSSRDRFGEGNRPNVSI